MKQTVHAVPGKVGLLLFLLGKKASKTGNSQEMLCSTSWEMRFLTAPISSPTGLCPQHLLQFRQPGMAWVHRLLTTGPPRTCSLEMHSPVLVARTGSGVQQHCCRNTPATFHPLLSRVWGQNFLGFKHLPSSQNKQNWRQPPPRLPQGYWVDF